MKVIIIEDEQHNYRLLRGMVEQLRPQWEISNCFESVRESVEWLQTNPAPDLIFMDIQLSDGISFSIFEQTRVESMVIFTTAYDEYALRAFEVNSIDYLLKPIKLEKLRAAIEKFEHLVQNAQPSTPKPNYDELIELLENKEKKYRTRFLVSTPTSFFKLDVKDIAWFNTENRVTTAYTYQGKAHVLDTTIEKLEEQLNPEEFFRTNRSSIVHIDAIRKFESHFGGKLVLKLIAPYHEESIIISRLKAASFKAWIDR